MNPSLLNYLQAQNSQSQGTPDNQIQGMGGAAYNPFDTGISKAIESARASLGMTQKQQDKALRSSMLAFANNMSQQPKERGFFNNFASVGRAMSPALSTYDQEESAALNENNALANQILQYQAQEQQRRALEEQRAWQRQHSEAQLGESRRYHDLMAQKNNPAMNVNIGGLGENFIPLKTESDRRPFKNDKKAIGTALHDLEEVEKKYKAFRKKYADNVVDPMSPYAPIANPVKDFFGKITDAKKLREETADRKDLNGQLNTFQIKAENSLRGGGILGPGLFKLFNEMSIYPKLGDDTPEDFEKKIARLKKELTTNYNAANLSLQYNAHIDPYQLSNLEQGAQGQGDGIVPDSTLSTDEPHSNDPEDYVAMRDLDGKEWEVPANQVSRYKNNGFERVE